MSEIKVARQSSRGMSQDFSKSKFPQDLSFENWNIRLVATDSQSSYAIINEKGNKQISTTTELEGIIIGHCVIEDYVVLFTTNDSGIDRIYRLTITSEINNSIETSLLFQGNLNFSRSNPIETIGWYENDNTVKVYWIDGVNQLRLINIKNNYMFGYSDTIFDFLVNINLNEINVQKNFASQTASLLGLFPSGVVQYGYSLYYKNGQETKLSHLTPIWYVSSEILKGEEVNTNALTSFSLSIDVESARNDSRFWGIKVYRFFRSTLNEVPQITVIYDQEITDNTVNITDNGSLFVTEVTPTAIETLGSMFVIPKTFEHKNNRLFIANYETRNVFIDRDLANTIRDNITWSLRNTPYVIDAYSTKPIVSTTRTEQTEEGTYWLYNPEDNNRDITYYYKNFSDSWITNLNSMGYRTYRDYVDNNGSVTSLKRRETYRFGFQLADEYENWTNAIFLEDISISKENCDLYGIPYEPFTTIYDMFQGYNGIIANHISIDFIISDSLKTELQGLGYNSWRIVRVQRDENNSQILSQGIISGTMFGTQDRRRGTWGMPDYLTRNLHWNYYLGQTPRINPTIPAYAGGPYAVTGPLGFFDCLSGTANPRRQNRTFIFKGKEWVFSLKYEDEDMTLENYHSTGWRSSVLAHIEGGQDAPESGTTPADRALWVNLNIMYSDSNLLQFYSPEITVPTNDQYVLNGLNVNIIGASECSWGNTILNDKYKNENKFFSRVGFRDRLILFDGNNVFNDERYWSKFMIIHQQVEENDNVSFTVAQKHRSFMKYYGSNFYLNTPYNLTDTNTRLQYTSSDSGLINVQAFNSQNNSNMRFNSNISTTYSLFKEDTKYVNFEGKDARSLVFALPAMRNSNGDEYMYAIIPKGTRVTSNGFNGLEYISILDRSSDANSIQINQWLKSPTVFIAEITRTLGNQYGSSELNQNEYIPVSSFVDFDSANSLVCNVIQGDVFLQRFDMLKSYISNPTDYQTIASAMTILLETSTNLDKRYDSSRYAKDNMYSVPESFFKVNPVYNQENNFRKAFSLDNKVENIVRFPNNIITTEVKINGNDVDNWTHFLHNENMQIEGSYGGITKLININSYMYAIQENAICYLLIEPRIQINPSDGQPIEMGSGKLFEDYRYMDTSQGTKNKWGVTKAINNFYFIDENNKSINVFGENGVTSLSVVKGISTLIHKMPDYPGNINSNHFSSMYDKNNNEVYFIFKYGNGIEGSITYSEVLEEFMSRYSYKPNGLIRAKDRLFAYDNSYLGLWEQFEGNYNSFFGTLYPSSITYLTNCEDPFTDKIFNNLEWQSEFYSGTNYDIDEFDKTWNGIRVWNEYQDTTEIPLVLNKNLKRRFRIWRATIPRMRNKGISLNRIRNNWSFVKIIYNPTINLDYKTILHDSIIHYTV